MRSVFISLFLISGVVSNSARAGIISYDVNLDTAALIGHPAGPFSLELQLNDGNGIGDGNNTASLTSLVFSNGSATGSPTLNGGASGNLSSSVGLTDNNFFNQFVQSFTPGATLSFQLALTTNLDSGGVPDEFSLAILDSSGFEIPTLGSANALLIIDINSSAPTISSFRTDTNQTPSAGGRPIGISAPQITVVSSVPEPSPVVLLSAAMCALALSGRRRVSSICNVIDDRTASSA